MIVITQNLLNSPQLYNDQEAYCHKNAFEYMPNAKSVSYTDLAGGRVACLLNIRLTGSDENEKKITEALAYMKMLASARRVLLKHFDYLELLSLSYSNELNRLKSEGLNINALVITENQDLIPAALLTEIESQIYEDLNIAPAKPIIQTDNMQETTSGSAQETEANETGKLTCEKEEVIEDCVLKDETPDINSAAVIEQELVNKNNSSVELKQNKTLAEPEENKYLQEENLTHSKDFIPDIAFPDNNTTVAENKDSPSKTLQPQHEKMRNAASFFRSERFSRNHDKSNRNDNKITGGKTSYINTEIKSEGDITLDIESSPEAMSAQKDAYLSASEERPFLNFIDTYIPSQPVSLEHESIPTYELHEEDWNIQTTASKAKMKKIFENIVSYYLANERSYTKRAIKGEVEQNEFAKNVSEYISRYHKLSPEDTTVMINRVIRAFYSYHVLIAAINDPDISDIRVLAPDNINVKVHGRHYKVKGIKFVDVADYNAFIENILIKNDISINSPVICFTDKEFCKDYRLCFNICLPVINSEGLPYLHIRKIPKAKADLKTLISKGMLSTKIAAYLLEKVRTSKGIVFAGPSAFENATLINALIDYIPPDKSGLCIQASDEIFSDVHPNIYLQHMVKDNRGNIVVGLSELGQNGLQCDSDYFIIDECNGAEIHDLLRALNTGHKCWCSVLSQSSKETISRLADYVKYGTDYTLDEAIKRLKTLEVVVYIENYKITEISEIAGYNEELKNIVYRPIYRAQLSAEQN